MTAATFPAPMLSVEHLSVHFAARRRSAVLPWQAPEILRAVDEVSFTLDRNETLGLVGESGSGKTTLGRAIVGLAPIAHGRIAFDGADISQFDRAAARELHRQIQLVFQDPGASLNPKLSIEAILSEPLDNFALGGSRTERRARVERALVEVGLPSVFADRYPHQLSGGQRQRVGIARALLLTPRLIICDEPVAALDVSVRAQLLNILVSIQRATGVSMIFIGHDIAVVEFVSDRIAVMYKGRIVEIGTAADVVLSPLHPYTKHLIDAVPVAEPSWPHHAVRSEAIRPLPEDPSNACVYTHICPLAIARCSAERPALRALGGRHVACHVVN